MSPKTIHFKSKRGYQKWLAFGHLHHVFHGKENVVIAGHKHKVEHSFHRSINKRLKL